MMDVAGNASLPCPCGRLDAQRRPLALAACCGRFRGDTLEGGAPDAESLMRSRYTAFVVLDREWLLASWHESTRPATLELDPAVKWLGLDVKDHRVIDETHAEVEFLARFRIGGGRAERLHERSRFVKEGGRWYYVDGAVR